MRITYRAKHSKQTKMRLPLSAYLSYLLIAALLFTGVSFSKFATTQWNGDSARVAVVVVEGGSTTSNTSLSLGDGVTSAEYPFYITNINADDKVSEVSLDYTVSVTIPGGEELPNGVAVALTYGSTACDLKSSANGVYTFEGGAYFAAGVEAQHNYILKFTADESLITDDSNFTDISISVKAEQID